MLKQFWPKDKKLKERLDTAGSKQLRCREKGHSREKTSTKRYYTNLYFIRFGPVKHAFNILLELSKTAF